MINLILCVFSEFFCSDPDLKKIRLVNKEIVREYPQVVERGCGIREGCYYLQFQTLSPLSKEESKFLAEQLYETLKGKRKELNRPLEALLIFKNTSDGEFYQIDLQNDLFNYILLQ